MNPLVRDCMRILHSYITIRNSERDAQYRKHQSFIISHKWQIKVCIIKR